MAVCNMLRMSNITTTKYHPQKNCKAERFIYTISLRLCHYVSEHWTNWHTYLWLLRYSYKDEMHRSITVSPLHLELTWANHGPTTVGRKRPSLACDDESATAQYTRTELIRQATSLHEEALINLRLAQKRTNVTMTAMLDSSQFLRQATRLTWKGLYFSALPPNGPSLTDIASCCQRKGSGKRCRRQRQHVTNLTWWIGGHLLHPPCYIRFNLKPLLW